MINLPLTEPEAKALQAAIIVAQNNYVDFPDKATESKQLHDIFAKINNALNPMMATGVKSTVQPNERNDKQQGRI